MDTKKIISERIALFLELRGMRQRELAKAIDKTPSLVSQYISGDKQPGVTTLGQIAEALGVTLGEFFGSNNYDARFNRHSSIIKQFQQRELAEEINEDLVTLESHKKSELKGVSHYVKARLMEYADREKDKHFKKNKTA